MAIGAAGEGVSVAAAAEEAAPAAGTTPIPSRSDVFPSGVNTPSERVAAGQRRGWRCRGVGGRGLPSGGPTSAGATSSLTVATLPMRKPPPGKEEDEGVEETGSAWPLSVVVTCWCLPAKTGGALLTAE